MEYYFLAITSASQETARDAEITNKLLGLIYLVATLGNSTRSIKITFLRTLFLIHYHCKSSSSFSQLPEREKDILAERGSWSQ